MQMNAVYTIRQMMIQACIVLIAVSVVSSNRAYGQNKLTAILFKNVRIFDGNASAVTPPSYLLVEGDTIAKISSEPISSPDEYLTTVIDGKNRVLIPGLIDAHYHSAGQYANPDVDYGYNYIVAGVSASHILLEGFTTVRDLGGPSFGLKKAIDDGIISGPRIYPSGAMISQTGGHGDSRSWNELNPKFGGNVPLKELNGGSVIVDGRTEVLAAVREQLRHGASQIKLATTGGAGSEYDPIDGLQFTLDEIKAAVEVASDWGTYVTVHNYTPEGARRAIEAGVKVIDHGQLLDEPTIKLIAEKGIWLSLQPFVPPSGTVVVPDFKNKSSYAKYLLITSGTDNVYRLAKKYHVKIAFGTDSGPSEDQLQKLSFLSRWFTAPEVLHQVTAANGELIALSGRRNPYPKKLGVIEVGAYADLLLVDGNPLENIKLLETPEKSLFVVVKNGKVYKNTIAQ